MWSCILRAFLEPLIFFIFYALRLTLAYTQESWTFIICEARASTIKSQRTLRDEIQTFSEASDLKQSEAKEEEAEEDGEGEAAAASPGPRGLDLRNPLTKPPSTDQINKEIKASRLQETPTNRYRK